MVKTLRNTFVQFVAKYKIYVLRVQVRKLRVWQAWYWFYNRLCECVYVYVNVSVHMYSIVNLQLHYSFAATQLVAVTLSVTLPRYKILYSIKIYILEHTNPYQMHTVG
jgi:hypothetical protein